MMIMSWRIKTLLFNYVRIKTEQDIESDDFNDLIVLEKQIEKLYISKILSEEELKVLKAVAETGGVSPAAEKLGKSIFYTTEVLNRTCIRIENIVGNEFMDSKYLENLKEKYFLSDEDIEKLRAHMNSKYKFKIKRKPNE